MGRLTGRLFVGFTTALICFIAYSSQIFVIWPWYGRVLSVELLTLLVPFNVLVGMLFWNYYLCTVTDPGRVPHGWQPDVQGNDGYEIKKLTHGPRFCRTCETYKPPRAHHCRQCKRCVLRMDHHCPWVNNCVGHFNYGHFIRFLFYVDCACTYHLAMISRRIYLATQVWENFESAELIFIILNMVTCIPVWLAVGGFTLYHFWMLSGNSTTIEGWEKDKVATLVRRGKIHEIKFPYNLGVWRNICSVLGDSPLWWCWPTVPAGTGLKYQLAEGDDGNAENWPPEDPSRISMPEADPNYKFTLPPSPWTYENGSVNPYLQPSNARRRQTARNGPYAALPPYHPDYREPEAVVPYDPASSSEDEYGGNPARGVRVRRGSEGYEVKTIDREAMLRGSIEGRTHEPGRYNYYNPEVSSESEAEDDQDDSTPLAAKLGGR
ncbi:zf-DHHC-domain-containing protein [Fomitopsis serialis]|uniref:zf-DHHC-domain-containing protein n=1 Tax=Fomitopsis serialis TaxID=139415 RepID=UPI002008D923|nr:zf-DHHC-domain-containing protein [Neoantrodia serialis]KAH9923635.1 zf-DHHC-domain-containing protein [Neoantrodia serialis]